MPFYKAVFRLHGGSELKAERGLVPPAFFDAIKKVSIQDIVDIHEGGFILSTEMHDKLSIKGTYASYAIVGLNAPEGSNRNPEFMQQLLNRLHITNHARPLEMHYNYQIFVMEYVEEVPEDD